MKSYKTKNMNLQLFAGETITDLTGYTWVGNSRITANPPVGYGLIDFISNNSTFHEIAGVYPELTYDDTFVCDLDEGIWVNEAYRTIQITGGTDANNSTLIAWLEENGTLFAPQPLGYSSTITLTNCTCNKSDETGLTGSYSATITADDGYYLSSVTSTLGTITIATNKKTATITIADVNTDFTITALGTAIEKLDIILHPNANGVTDYTKEILPKVRTASTLEINRLFRTEYTITTSITNGSASGNEKIWSEETENIVLIPDENYNLPKTITINGVTGISGTTGVTWSYNSSTGIVNLSNATGNVSVSCVCELIGSTVMVTFQNGLDTEYWVSTKIYSDYSIDTTNYIIELLSTNEVGSISSVNNSTNILTTTGKLFILGQSSTPAENYGSITCSNGITNDGALSPYYSTGNLFDKYNYSVYLDGVYLNNASNCLCYDFTITANGTITIDGADWYD